MKDMKFVNASEMETLEQYLASLLSSMISLKTLQQFHVIAEAKGLLEESEDVTGKTICVHIEQLLRLYRNQVDNILERTQIDEQTILDGLRAIMPEVKIPRKRKNVKKQPIPDSNQ